MEADVVVDCSKTVLIGGALAEASLVDPKDGVGLALCGFDSGFGLVVGATQVARVDVAAGVALVVLEVVFIPAGEAVDVGGVAFLAVVDGLGAAGTDVLAAKADDLVGLLASTHGHALGAGGGVGALGAGGPVAEHGTGGARVDGVQEVAEFALIALGVVLAGLASGVAAPRA